MKSCCFYCWVLCGNVWYVVVCFVVKWVLFLVVMLVWGWICIFRLFFLFVVILIWLFIFKWRFIYGGSCCFFLGSRYKKFYIVLCFFLRKLCWWNGKLIVIGVWSFCGVILMRCGRGWCFVGCGRMMVWV